MVTRNGLYRTLRSRDQQVLECTAGIALSL